MIRPIFGLLFPFVICGLLRSQEPEDLKIIQGKWYMVELESHGQSPKKNKPRASVFLIKGNKMYMDDDFLCTFSLDPEKSPKQIDGISEKSVTSGIYKLGNESLTVCWSSAPKDKAPERPKEFKTSREKPFDRMFVLKRTEK